MDFTNLFGRSNPAQGMRMPSMGTGMDLYGGQPSQNLGMTMPSPNYGDGLGIKPPSSFGQMPSGGSGFDPSMAMMLLGNADKKEAPMQQPQLPGGSNQDYEQLLKMYGVGGLLG